MSCPGGGAYMPDYTVCILQRSGIMGGTGRRIADRRHKMEKSYIVITHVGCFMNDNRIVLKGTNKRDTAGFLLFVFLLPYVCACLWGHVGEETDALRGGVGGAGEKEQIYKIQIGMDWGAWEIPMEEYLVYKLQAVMPDEYAPEALKAQAVLLRTELVQVLKEQGTESIRVTESGVEKWYGDDGQAQESLKEYVQAVEETEGLYLCYQGEPIQASYFKISNGQTRDAKEVWKTDKTPYLTRIDCVQDKASKEFGSEVAVSKVNYLYEVKNRIGEGYASEDLWENVRFDYDEAGYVTNVSFYEGEKKIGQIDGETFRYMFSLPSASFEMERDDMRMIFHVTGVGHGFGMSQYAANSRAINGEDCTQILADFFPGTELAKFE